MGLKFQGCGFVSGSVVTKPLKPAGSTTFESSKPSVSAKPLTLILEPFFFFFSIPEALNPNPQP